MTVSIRAALFVAYTAALLLGGADIVRALVDFSSRDSSASHLVVIPLIALGLLLQDRAKVFASVHSAWVPGGAVIVAGLAGAVLALQGRPGPMSGLWLGVASLATMWCGGFLAIFGRGAFAAARFPLAFLYFTAPIPAPVLDGAVEVLKTGSTEMVAALFSLIGMTYHRQGYLFELSTLSIEVADACSGIRSSIALSLTALLAGRNLLSRPWSRGLLLLAVLPVTIVKNAIRIVALSWLAINVDPSFLSGRLHTDGGAAFFVLALALMVPVIVVLRRAERRRAKGGPADQTPTLPVPLQTAPRSDGA